MLKPCDIHPEHLGELRAEVLKQAKLELKMNLSLIEMLKGNTPLEDLANLRKEWIEPLQGVIDELERQETVMKPQK
jgi:hypothetical protein